MGWPALLAGVVVAAVAVSGVGRRGVDIAAGGVGVDLFAGVGGVVVVAIGVRIDRALVRVDDVASGAGIASVDTVVRVDDIARGAGPGVPAVRSAAGIAAGAG